MDVLQHILDDLNIKATVVHKTVGIRTDRYELDFHSGVRTLPTEKTLDIIQVRLGADSRSLIKVPDKNCFVFEASYKRTSLVEMRDIIRSNEFKASPERYKFIVGKTPWGDAVIGNLVDAKKYIDCGAGWFR